MNPIEAAARAMWGASNTKMAYHNASDSVREYHCHQVRAAILAFLDSVQEPTEEMWTAGRAPIMAFQDASYGPKWNLGNHMDAGGYKGWATNEERKSVNVTKGDCAVFVWRAMLSELRKSVAGR